VREHPANDFATDVRVDARSRYRPSSLTSQGDDVAKTSTTRKPSASAELEAHRARLDELLTSTIARRDLARSEYEAIHDDGGDVGASQDEGGGEADVTAAERDRLRAAISLESEAIVEIEAAIARAQTDDWATCSQCGGPIGDARLEAMPSTDRCVTCKAGSTSW
jgi:RNA polymerase-binding transcription factor DksA